MSAPEVSIIIPSFHSLRTLGFTLRSVFAQESCPSYEVLVVDSSGVDLTGWIRTRYPQTRLIQPRQRHLPGAARNLGAAQARGRILAFLDADVIADPRWLSILISVSRSAPPRRSEVTWGMPIPAVWRVRSSTGWNFPSLFPAPPPDRGIFCPPAT